VKIPPGAISFSDSDLSLTLSFRLSIILNLTSFKSLLTQIDYLSALREFIYLDPAEINAGIYSVSQIIFPVP